MAYSYGSITLDGNLSDWTPSAELDNQYTAVSGYQVFGAYLLANSDDAPNYVFGIGTTAAGVTIGPGTTIYLNTDNNSATGYEVFGGEVGAEYEVAFDSSDTPYLYAYNGVAQTWTKVGTAPLNFAFNANDTAVEFAVPVADLADAPTSIETDISINAPAGASGATYVPGDYKFSDEITAPVTVGNIKLDGNISDWPSAPLAQIPANTVANYNVYGQFVTDTKIGGAYVIGVQPTSSSAPVIGANTFIYLNTDQNNATGYSPFSNIGAEYVVEFQLDANGYLQPYLYSATSSGMSATPLNGGNPLSWAPSASKNGFEIAIPQSLLTPTGGSAPTSINFAALLNNSIGLPTTFGAQPEYTINDTAAIPQADHSTKKVLIVYSQESAENYFKGAVDASGNPIPQANLTTAYDDLFMTAQDQTEAAGVPYDVMTADQLATMTAAQLSQYSAVVIPSMTNVQNAAQAQQITEILSQLESQYNVGIITSGNFMTADVNNNLLSSPYAAMQTLLGTTFSTSGTGSYSVSVDPSAVSNPIMASYAPGQLIGGASGQFTGTTTGYYTNTGYQAFTGLTGSNAVTLADINLTNNPGPGSVTTQSLPGVIQTTNNGSTDTLFATTGLFGDSNLAQRVIQNAVYGKAPSLTLDTTRFAGMVDSRTDMDQSQFPADIKPVGGGPGIYDEMLPIIQQWTEQYDFVGSFYMNVGLGASGSDNAGNNLTLTKPYATQLIDLGSEIGSHSTDHLINPPKVDANGKPIPDTTIDGQQVNSWSENTNTLYTTPPANGSAPDWTYNYEFGLSNSDIDQGLGITVAGAAVPGEGDTSADAENIMAYYPSGSGLEGYVSGGWTGVGSGSPNAFGYISPSQTGSVYIAPNITFDFSEVQYEGKTPTQSLADWETLFNQLSASSETPIIVWPWHDYGVTDWNTTTDTPDAGLYTTQMYTNFVQYAYNAGYEFVTTEDLAARVAAEQRAVVVETNPTASTINVSVTPGVSTDDLGAMALNLASNGNKIIENAGNWYAYDATSLYLAKGGVSNVNVTLGSNAPDDVTHIDYLPMRADLQSVTGDGSNLSFSFTGNSADTVNVQVKTPGANIVSVQGTNLIAANLSDDNYLSLTFDDTNLTPSATAPQAASILDNVTISDQATAVTAPGTNFLFGGSANDSFTAVGGTEYIDGGLGVNTMTFSGARANYTISVSPSGYVTVVDNRANSPDGTVTMTRIQSLIFADVTLSTSSPMSPVFNAPTYSGSAANGDWKLSGTASSGTTVSLYDRSLVSANNTTGLITSFTDTASNGAWTYSGLAANAGDSLEAVHDFYATSFNPGSNSTAVSGDYWVGTSGDDIFSFSSEQDLSGGGVWGDGGKDTISFATGVTLSDADFANVHLGGLSLTAGTTADSSAIVLALSAFSTVNLGADALAAGISTVNVGSGGGSLTDINSGTLTVNASAVASTATLDLSSGSGSEGFTVSGLGGVLNASAVTGALTVSSSTTSAATITGGSGTNTFVYTDGTTSPYSHYDTIAAFGSADRFEIGHSVAQGDYQTLTNAASGNLYNDLVQLLSSPARLAAHGADLVTLTGAASDAGSYVVINNAGAAGYNGSADAVIKLSAGASNVHATSFVV